MEQRFRKVTGYVEKKIGDELVIVPVASEVAQMNKVFSLNEVGLFIYDQLLEPKTETEILHLVCKEFEVYNQVAKDDIKVFISEAIKAKIIKPLD
ncbi:PqqD family protein [Carboxylicivirga caseinilyticus]|uniref:PqqD family protein n=1 Tax=Carboxylicivirga caseinilyticus TaxID=3417572 RepID=UPI003D33676F|nr:PqqD family protein [Marinilabiliaceae bacterium A049]